MIDGSEKRKRQLVFELQSSRVYESAVIHVFFFSSKELSPLIFYTLFRVSSHQIVGKKIKLNLFYKLSYLSSNFSLTLG